MAKGDDSRARNRIDYEGGLAQNHLDNVRNEIIPKQQELWNRMFSSGEKAMGDYSGLMNQFKGDYGNVMNKFGEFSQTGGFSPEDLANIRSRAISPTRAVYSNAQQGLDRNRALQGGYSPNYAASSAKMAREMSQGLSDASTNAEASIAEMTQRGKLAGLQGMGSTMSSGMSGLTNLFGQTPGMANMFGNQQQGAMDQWLRAQGMQNELGLGKIGAQIQAGQMPGKWEHTMGRIGQIGQIGAGMMFPFLGGGGLTAPGGNLFGRGGMRPGQPGYGVLA